MTALPEALGLSPDQVEAVLVAAASAPSVHNTQPWRFRLSDDSVEVHADPERRLPVVDPDDRELRLSCGAALFNLRLAVESHGVRPLVSLVPDHARPSLVAVVRRGGPARPRRELDELVRAIPLRRTNRLPFLDQPVPEGHRRPLVEAAEAERAWLHVVRDREQRAELRAMVVRATELLHADPEYRAELARWTGREPNRTDGVPSSAGGPRREPQDEWVLRDFTGGQARPRLTGKDFEDDPLLVVLCSHYEGRVAEVQTGQAMEHVLLTATALGLAVSFLSQVIEVPSVRDELRRMVGGGLEPQTVLRIGFGSPVPAVPRRPVAELLVRDSAAG
ncbi:Acg family FMN-binding oxidoreductase [Streptoalloteichus hindustanus]|uniref:Nitroreductase family protein n=1 Tax=Streptoalloteichus hindustanus TaxID=2017 RepID=A0A1M5DSN1_STRHI|nr:nitroreductase family protein [Streptoalloteichus hindustanus]SHF69782.1 Nitroreductase family protein [Streptoalloteichus hindustanus]